MDKKRIVILLITILLTFAGDVRADTLVLKDGRVIRCDTVREEGNVVRYWIGEAQLSISRDRVERIERGGERGEALSGSPKASSTNGAARLAELPDPKLLLRETTGPSATPFNPDLQKKLEAAAVALTEGRYTDALAGASRAVEIDPTNQLAYYQLGAACYALEKLPEAIKAWKSALKIKNHPGIRAAMEKAEREMAVASDFTKNRSRFFNISMEGDTLDTTLESGILGLLEESYGQLKRRFDYEPNEKISAIFYTRDTFFNITNAPSWAGALNDGKLRIPVGGLKEINDELSRTVMHELTHSFVFFKARGKCPTWLNEGLAQIMEGKSAAGYRSRLADLATKGTLPSLQNLSGSFTKLSTAQASVAYAYSLAATEILAERDLRSAIKVLEELGQNYNISVALSRHTRYQDLEEFERELRRRLSQ
jgi:tetratricopeptide (TPR) repeat protein